MGKYIKKFDTHAEYETYITGSDKILPNVSYCVDNNDVHYNPWSDPRLIVKYNVEDDSNPTMLYTCMSNQSITLNGVDMFDKVELDGVEMSITDLDSASGQYQLSVGEHIARYTLKDPTFIGIEVIDESTQQINIGATFIQCTAISEVKIPNTVTIIAYMVFNSCNGFTNIVIPNSVTSIGESAFYNCTGLTSVTIPNSVTSIGSIAFSGCSGLTNVTIGNGVTSIGEGAFESCNGLTSVTIGNSVTEIDGFAFQGCSSLTSIVIPNTVTTIGEGAFGGCSGLTSINIPNSVTTIGDNAFTSCSSLTSIKVDGGNTVYDSRNNCNAIIEIATNRLIAGCKNTVIPNSVTSIADTAFYNCNGLTSVTIPNSVTTIGDDAFDGCTGLTSITIQATTPPTLGYAVFDNNASGRKIYVPSASVNAYKTASGWSDYAADIEAIQ